MKMSDVSMYTCRTTGISELYWDGGRICIELGNDIDKATATKIFESVRDHDRLISENARLREALLKIHRMQERTPEFPDDYSHDDVGYLNDRIDEVFGIANTVLTKLEKGDE